MATARCEWTLGWTEIHSQWLWVEGSSSSVVAGQAKAGMLVQYAG
jgi:hypothetical protein